MWQFLGRNKQVAAMLGVLALAAFVVVVIATKRHDYKVTDVTPAETDDISKDPYIFSTNK